LVARTGIEPVIFTLKGPERNRVFIGFFAASSDPCTHIALIAEGSVSYAGIVLSEAYVKSKLWSKRLGRIVTVAVETEIS
jgi:hypothetical protein